MIKKIVIIALFIILAVAVIAIKSNQKKTTSTPSLPASTDTGMLDDGTITE